MNNVNIVEICRVTDPKASYFIEVNKRLGYDVFEFNNKYYLAFITDLVYRG